MRWGVALGGGGIPGVAAHLGFLRALREAGTAPDVVVGASAGGLVAGALAAGVDVDAQMAAWERIAADPWPAVPGEVFHTLSLLRRSPTPGSLSLSPLVDRVLRNAPFPRLPEWTVDRGVVVSDLTVGSTSLLANDPRLVEPIRRWTAADAMVATAAFPTLFSGVRGPDGHLYADGGIYDLVPVDACRHLACDRVVSIRIGYPTQVPDTLSVEQLLQVVTTRLLAATDRASNPQPADLALTVPTAGGLLSLADFASDAAAGAAAAQSAAMAIQSLLRE